MTEAANNTIKSRRARSSERAQASAILAGDRAATLHPASKQDSKISKVIALLERQEGATLDEMVAATGWLPHTARAALTGLKKKGQTIERSKRGETSCYRTKTGA